MSDGMVPVLNPSGELVQIPADSYSDALQFQGYRAPPPETLAQLAEAQKYEGPLEGLKAFGEGALGTLTFGAGPAAEAELLGNAKEQLGRREAQPLPHAAGAVLGVAAPLLLTAGMDAPVAGAQVARFTAPALIARAGQAVAKLGAEGGALARVGTAALGAATEGALYGGSDVVERHLLGDPSLTAEKAVAEVGLSALIPGLLVGGAAATREALAPFADKLIAKGAAAAQAKKVAEEADLIASAEGSQRSSIANMFRQFERNQFIVDHPTQFPEAEVAEAAAWNTSDLGKKTAEAFAKSTGRARDEAFAEWMGKTEGLADLKAGSAQRIAEGAAALQDPSRLGELINERVVQRYGSRAALGWLFGSLTGIGGPIGTLGGLSYGPMKDVIKRILRDPSLYSSLGRFLKSPGETLSAMAGLGRLSGKTDEAVAQGLNAIFGNEVAAGSAEAMGNAVTPGNYPHVAGNLSGYGSNLDKLAEDTSRETERLRNHAPATTDALHGVAARGVERLDAVIPRGGDRKPLDPPYVPSAAELAAYNRVHEIAEKPTRILNHIANGTITQDHVQTLAAIYPKLYVDWKAKAMDRLAKEIAKGRRPSAARRLALSAFMGQDLDSSTTQQHIAASQSAFATAAGPAKPAAQGTTPLKIAARTATASQRRAMREEA